MAESQDLLRDQVMGLVFLLENLGFVINYPRSQLEPTQEIEFLGFVVNSQTMELQAPRGETQEDQVRRQKDVRERPHNGPNALPPTRKNECCNTSSENGSSVLPESSVLPQRGSPGLPGLRVHSDPHP